MCLNSPLGVPGRLGVLRQVAGIPPVTSRGTQGALLLAAREGRYKRRTRLGARVARDDFRVEVLEGRRLSIELRGDLTPEVAEALEGQVAKAIATLPPRGFDAVFDLCKLESSSIFARATLVRVQQALKGRARRTAYLADRARFRGLALWVINLAEDKNAKAVMNTALVEEWLADASDDRLEEIKTRTAAAVAGFKRGRAG